MKLNSVFFTFSCCVILVLACILHSERKEYLKYQEYYNSVEYLLDEISEEDYNYFIDVIMEKDAYEEYYSKREQILCF